MIEVEKKFVLNEDDKKRLIKEAQFLKEIVFADVYFDSADYVLTREDLWLRSRDNKFELKVPLQKLAHGERIADQYDELLSFANYLDNTYSFKQGRSLKKSF